VYSRASGIFFCVRLDRPEAAQFQVARVARERKLPNEQVATLVQQATEPPRFGFLGGPRVNVLQLNQLLDRLH